MLAQSLRYGVRSLRRTPASSLVIIVTLSVAIGAAVAVFSTLNATLLAPLPFSEPGRVVLLRTSYSEGGAATSVPLLLDHRTRTQSFENVSAMMPWAANLTGAGEPERLQGLLVTAEFLSMIGVRPFAGRVFVSEDGQPGRDHVVLVSHGFWRRRLGGQPDVVGSRLQLNGESYEVVGILAPNFTWSRVYGRRQPVADVLAPFALTPERSAENQRGNEFLDAYARLRPGVSTEQAQADLDREVVALRAAYPRRYTVASGFRIRVVSARDELVGEVRPVILAVFASVLLLLVVAATNVAGLLIARASGRQREMSVHAALGAGRSRLVAQHFGEAATLAVAAGVLGLVQAYAAVAALDQIDPAMLPRSAPIRIDAAVAAFAVGLIALVTLLAGVLPSWQTLRGDLSSALRISPQNSSANTSRAGQLLIVAQTALTLALLVGAGLLVQSVVRLNEVSAGFRDDVSAVQIQLPRFRYADAVSRIDFLDGLLARLGASPGLVAAAVSELPLSGVSNSGSFDIDGHIIPPERQQPHAEFWSATPDYFAVLGIPVERGRVFDQRDVQGRQPTAIVSETFAKRYFPGEDPIGKRIDFEGNEKTRRWREIVGVVGDVRDRGLDRAAEPQLYMPYAQRGTAGFFIVTRGTGDPSATLTAVRAAVADADPELPIYNATTMTKLKQADTRNRWVAGIALAVFALASVAVACLGLYGLVAHSVRQRVREIGVRVAVGAAPAEVLRLFLRDGLWLLACGITLGIGIAVPSARLLRNLVFGLSTTDPATYVGVAVVLMSVGLATSAIPAWRAARIDPVAALRL
jgi:putative ABC transport system permease protein